MVTDAGLCLMAIVNLRLSPSGEQFPSLKLFWSCQGHRPGWQAEGLDGGRGRGNRVWKSRNKNTSLQMAGVSKAHTPISSIRAKWVFFLLHTHIHSLPPNSSPNFRLFQTLSGLESLKPSLCLVLAILSLIAILKMVTIANTFYLLHFCIMLS